MPKKGNQPLQAMFATLSSILQKRFLNNHSEMKPPTLESKTALHVKQVLLLFTQEQPSVDKKIANRHADPAESGSQVSDKGEVVNETRIWEIESENRRKHATPYALHGVHEAILRIPPIKITKQTTEY
jgi:hypothetical protein